MKRFRRIFFQISLVTCHNSHMKDFSTATLNLVKQGLTEKKQYFSSKISNTSKRCGTLG